MSVTPISMTQVQGVLRQAKRNAGAGKLGVMQPNGISRFEALLREPQQIAEAMTARNSSASVAVPEQHNYFGLINAQQISKAGMNLQNASQLATLVNLSSVDSSVFSQALKTLTDAAERNQLETTAASGVASQEQIAHANVASSSTVEQLAEVADSAHHVEVAEQEATEVVAVDTQGMRGSLAASFESGRSGDISAIGYDNTGGTSYGKFQFSSARGTMDDFLTYLDTHASDISLHLRAAGEVNTGSRSGEMPTAWKEVAEIDPVRFEKMQDSFMESRYFTPVARVIQDKMNIQSLSSVMEEVLLSTSLQHGPSGAVRIFAKAYGTTGSFSDDVQEDFIRNVYALRQDEFSTSTPTVRDSVMNRLQNELGAALSMLA